MGGYENLFSKKLGWYYLKSIQPQRASYDKNMVRHLGKRAERDINQEETDPIISNIAFYNLQPKNQNDFETLSSSINLDLLSLANVSYVVSYKPLNDKELSLISKPIEFEEKDLPSIGLFFKYKIIPILKYILIYPTFIKDYFPKYHGDMTHYLGMLYNHIPYIFKGQAVLYL